MAAPSFFNFRVLRMSGGSLMPESIMERKLSALAVLASRQNPDGTLVSTGTVVTPPPVAGYFAWYDASQIAQADNTPLASWPDASGNGNTLTQATPANQPTFYSSTAGKLVNGKPAVWFNVANSTSMQGPLFSSPLAQPATVFVVGQQTTAPSGSYATFIDGNAQRWNISASNTAWVIYAGGSVIPQGTQDFAVHCLTAVFASPGYIFVDSTQNSGTSGNYGLDQIYFGVAPAGGSPQNYLTGPICEVIYYNSQLSLPQINSVQAYLKAKWGTP